MRLLHNHCSALSFLKRLLLVDVLWSVIRNHLSGVDAVICYCTYAECKAAFCEGDYCLVGFRKENDRGQIFQQCTTTEIGKEIAGPCRSDFLNLWEDVCRCSKNNCNTYAFYRRAMEAYVSVQHADPEWPQVPPGSEDPEFLERPLGDGFSNSQLIILLICVPLGVGVVAVVFVFINYHCKL